MDKLEYIRFLTGDIVYIHGSIRVISSCDGYYATYYDEDETLQEVNVNVIEGIPLTPEILEKNGRNQQKKVLGIASRIRNIKDLHYGLLMTNGILQ